jgi:hypothetical protein
VRRTLLAAALAAVAFITAAPADGARPRPALPVGTVSTVGELLDGAQKLLDSLGAPSTPLQGLPLPLP